MNSACDSTISTRSESPEGNLSNPKLTRLLPSLVCPDCRMPLEADAAGLKCAACRGFFSSADGPLKLWPPSRSVELEASIERFKGTNQGVRQSPLFRALLPPSPVCDPGASRRHQKIKETLASGLVVNLGAKNANWGEHVINVDLVKPQSGSVDVLADIQRLPFADASLDGVICTYVLEHVADARACIDEIVRVIKPGGHAYITVPFLFPTHPDPLDRWRWTLDGLRYSMRAFDEVSAGSCGGPFTTLLCVTPTLYASVFSNFYLFNAIRCFLGWVMWPIKFLDYLAWRSEKVHMTAPNFFFFGRKR